MKADPPCDIKSYEWATGIHRNTVKLVTKAAKKSWRVSAYAYARGEDMHWYQRPRIIATAIHLQLRMKSHTGCVYECG